MAVSRGNKQNRKKNKLTKFIELEKADYSERKLKKLTNQTKCSRFEIDENEVKPNKEKVEAILKPLENTKELNFSIRATQYMATILTELSKRVN